VGGIGLEVAKLFAKEGAEVIVVDIKENVIEIPSQLEPPKEHLQKHSAYKCDISKIENVKELFQNIKEKYPKQKGPNVVVNCVIFIYFNNVNNFQKNISFFFKTIFTGWSFSG